MYTTWRYTQATSNRKYKYIHKSNDDANNKRMVNRINRSNLQYDLQFFKSIETLDVLKLLMYYNNNFKLY